LVFKLLSIFLMSKWIFGFPPAPARSFLVEARRAGMKNFPQPLL